MNTRSLMVLAAFALGGALIWRAMKISDLVRKGWPRWMAEIEIDFLAWGDCADPEAWPS